MNYCVSCIFFVNNENDDSGVCHRYPPNYDPQKMMSWFSHVKDKDWCGEWRMIKDTK